MVINNAVNASQAGVQCQTSAGVWNGRTITAGTGISVTNGDGVSGNPTISATGSSGGLGNVFIYEEFLGTLAGGTPNQFYGNIGWTNKLSSSEYLVYGTPTSDHPGVLAIFCRSAGSGVGVLMAGNSTDSATGILLGGGEITYETVIQLSQTGTALQDYNCYFGLSDLSTVNVEVSNGVYFHYRYNVNSGNWVGKTASGGSRNSVNSSVAASTSWTKLGFTINAAATSVEFFINGSSIGTQTLTIPSGNIGFFYHMINVAGTDLKYLNIDLMTFTQTLTNSR